MKIDDILLEFNLSGNQRRAEEPKWHGSMSSERKLRALKRFAQATNHPAAARAYKNAVSADGRIDPEDLKAAIHVMRRIHWDESDIAALTSR